MPTVVEKLEQDKNKTLAAHTKSGPKDPSLSTFLPTTSKDPNQKPLLPTNEEKKPTCTQKLLKYLYNREEKTFCDRTCKSWIAIIAYALMYIVFLSTYTMIFLFGSLTALKHTVDYRVVEKLELLTYSENGIGLTAVPTAEDTMPIIWYRNGESNDYAKYVNALDRLLHTDRRKRDVSNRTDLGPCGNPPYGYGDKPCIIVKINKQMKWAGKPLDPKSSKAEKAPVQVRNWIAADKNKLWLHCDGYHSYDKEHIGQVKYYPDPPGFDPDLFPLDMQSKSPVVAVQISNFALGISLAIECKLWYEQGPATVEFLLYVTPDVRVMSNNSI